MKETREVPTIKYLVRIKDPANNRRCDVYVSTDWDLELLLLFLRSVTGLEYDVSDLKKRL